MRFLSEVEDRDPHRKVSTLLITSKKNLSGANLSFRKEETASGSQLVSC